MARNPAAIAESCAPVPPTLSGMARGSEASPQTFSERLKAAEPMLRRLVPSLALVFVVVIGVAFTLQSITIRNETLTDSAGEIELISAYVTSELTASLAGQKLDSPKSVTNIVATLGRIRRARRDCRHRTCQARHLRHHFQPPRPKPADHRLGRECRCRCHYPARWKQGRGHGPRHRQQGRIGHCRAAGGSSPATLERQNSRNHHFVRGNSAGDGRSGDRIFLAIMARQKSR